MRISIQKNFKKVFKLKNRYLLKGFTFFEILLVLTLLVVLVGAAIPNFINLFSKPHESELMNLTRVVKILRNDAILKSNSYCIIFDLIKQEIKTSEEDNSGKCSSKYLTKPKILEPRSFHEGLVLREALLAEKNYHSLGNDTNFLEVRINNAGFVTPFFLLFSMKDQTKSWKIESKGIMGKLQLSLY